MTNKSNMNFKINSSDNIKVNSSQSSKTLPPSQSDQEIGGPKGLEPTRYGDWEKNGRVSDF